MAFEPFGQNYFSASFPFAVQGFTKLCILTHTSAEPSDVPKTKRVVKIHQAAGTEPSLWWAPGTCWTGGRFYVYVPFLSQHTGWDTGLGDLNVHLMPYWFVEAALIFSTHLHHMASLSDFFIHWHSGEHGLRNVGGTWSSLSNSFSSRIHGWTSPVLTGWVLLTSILVRSGQSWWCWRGHAAHGSHPWRVWSIVRQVQVCWGPRQALL